jgi:hypothetical protein
LISIRDGLDVTGGVPREPDPVLPPAAPKTPTKKGIRGKGLETGSGAAPAPGDSETPTAPATSSDTPETPGDPVDSSGIDDASAPEPPVVAPPETTPPAAPARPATGDVGELIRQATELLARIAAASSGVAEKPVSRLKVSKDLMKGEPTHDDSRVVELQAVVDALRKIAG